MKQEKEFLTGLRERGAAELTRLYEENAILLYNYILGRVRGNADAADDILSTVFCDAIDHVASLTPLHNVRAWLFRIAKSKIADHFRRLARESKWKEHADVETVPNGKGHGRDPEVLFIAGEESFIIRAAFASLADVHRDVLERMYVHGTSMREIAEATNRTEKSVESLLYRARKELERAIESLEKSAFPAYAKPRSEKESS
jgi:RNA polymerase sigma-70 factor (ECF subfamily)